MPTTANDPIVITVSFNPNTEQFTFQRGGIVSSVISVPYSQNPTPIQFQRAASNDWTFQAAVFRSEAYAGVPSAPSFKTVPSALVGASGYPVYDTIQGSSFPPPPGENKYRAVVTSLNDGEIQVEDTNWNAVPFQGAFNISFQVTIAYPTNNPIAFYTSQDPQIQNESGGGP